jgi:hypothetical protein
MPARRQALSMARPSAYRLPRLLRVLQVLVEEGFDALPKVDIVLGVAPAFRAIPEIVQ